MSNVYVQFRNERPYHRIWTRYEKVLKCVKRGNTIFQSSVLCLHFSYFTFTCLGIFYLLKLYKDSGLFLLFSFVAITSLMILRTIMTNSLMSHPYLCREQLKVTVADVMSYKWDSLSDEDRQYLAAFHERLGNENLAAMPFHLYTVCPSNLLSILSLIVTYVVVLLQVDV